MNVTIKGENEEHRELRNQLLESEIAMRDQTERVAALRRQLPAGPLIETDYLFCEGPPISETNPLRISVIFDSLNSSLPARTVLSSIT
jgi:predicted dithiol-disulfide oxidoreductase (DUF899 family)